MKVPDINAPLEQVDFESWVKANLLKLLAKEEAHDSSIASILEKLGMSAGSATKTNVQVRQNTKDIIELWDRQGLPPGAAPGLVVSVDREDKPVWLPRDEWPVITISLDPAGPSWEAFSFSGANWQAAVPEPTFEEVDGVFTVHLNPFDSTQVNVRAHYLFYLFPAEEGQRFHIELPMQAFGYSPDFAFTLYGAGDYNSVISLGRLQAAKADLFYAGTSARFQGWEDSGLYQVFTASSDFYGSWAVQNRGGGYLLMPVTRHQPDGATAIADDYYRANVAVPTGADLAELIRDTIAAALVAGSGISITVNDASNTILITNTGGGGPTTGYGAGVYGGLPDYGG